MVLIAITRIALNFSLSATQFSDSLSNSCFGDSFK